MLLPVMPVQRYLGGSGDEGGDDVSVTEQVVRASAPTGFVILRDGTGVLDTMSRARHHV